MNIFKRIRSWFQNTKPSLRWRIKKLTDGMHNLEEGVKSLEQELWKERKFKEDYRDRLTKYYDECVELRKNVKRHNKLLKRCKKFKEFYGKGCSKFISEMTRGQ